MLRSEPSTEHQGGVEHRAQTTNEAEGNVIDDNTINSPEHNREQNNVNNNGDHINNNNNNNNNVVVNGSNGINTQAIRVTVQEQPNDNFLCVNATKNANQAERRLMRDLRSLQKSVSRQQTENAGTCNGEAAFGISAHPVKNNLFLWHALISGPGNSPWEGGLFRLELYFSPSYPITPPNVRFLTPNVFHPNVYVNGHICLDTLKSKWNPALDVESLLMSITSLLADPNPASPANGEAAYMLVDNVGEYNRRIRECVESSLMQEFSESDCSSDDDEEDDKDVCDHLHLHPPPHHHNNGSENNYSGTSNTHTNSNSNGE